MRLCSCVQLRGVTLAIVAFAISACGGQADNVAAPSLDGPLYDPVGDWAPARPASGAYRLHPSAQRMRGMRVAADEPVLDAPRRFTEREIERISSVQEIVRAAASDHELPPDLVNGIIWVESRFQTQAQSSVGCRGLMQLMPSTAREIARELGLEYQPYDPAFNIHVGTYYFAHLVYRYSSLRLALAAYNIGPGVVDAWQRERAPLPERSQAYVDNVFSAARAFREFNP